VVRVATKGVNSSNVVTFEVKIEITSENRTLLRPEMTGTANIVCAARPDVMAIPAAAFSRASREAPSATTASSASASRRGGRGPARAVGPQILGAPMEGTVTVQKGDGTSEVRPVTVGLMGTDPADSMSGDLYEVISGLKDGEEVVLNKNGLDSKWKNGGPNGQPGMRGGGGR
jgi:hypothetical protein